MAHKQKYTKGAVGHMFGHYDRSKEVPDLPMPANTVLNYNLALNDQPKNQLEFLHQRLGEVKVHNRKDVNVMVDWVVTAPKDLPTSDHDIFFKESYKFLSERYGRENVISAYVHQDETTPHMHYSFVPVIEDKKKGGYKLSAKEVITREDLRSFHDDLSKYLKSVFGREVGILNEATQDGNKSIVELKRGTAQAELQQVKQKTQTILDAGKQLQEKMKDTESRITNLEAVYSDKDKKLTGAYENKRKALESKLEGLQTQIEGTQLQYNQIIQIQPQKTLTGAIKGVSIEDIENLKVTALASSKALEDNKDLRKENKRLKEDIKSLEKKVPSVLDSMKKAEEQIILTKKAKAFDLLPEDVKRQLLPKMQHKNKDFGHER